MMNHDHILVCCLCLRHWQMAHLVTPSDWIMGWQLDHHVLVTVSERSGNIGGRLMISFIEWLNSTACILIFGKFGSNGNFIWHVKRRLPYWYQISEWYDEVVRCRRFKICNFTKNKQGVSQCRHLQARVPPAAMPGWADERIDCLLHNGSKCE